MLHLCQTQAYQSLIVDPDAMHRPSGSTPLRSAQDDKLRRGWAKSEFIYNLAPPMSSSSVGVFPLDSSLRSRMTKRENDAAKDLGRFVFSKNKLFLCRIGQLNVSELARL